MRTVVSGVVVVCDLQVVAGAKAAGVNVCEMADRADLRK